ncbi:MAG: ABC transporter substrate-binding protein [Gammaproteobacteria bacterium]|nr:MAG: ABC transporter substrate-binding protein [Gammaproteobacteria bacterium]
MAVLPGTALPAADLLRFGLTPVILDDQVGFLRQWRNWLSERLHARVRFVQRRTYREISNELINEELDSAWVCGYPYVRHQPYMRLLAVPSYNGAPWYHSLIIRNHRLEKIHDITHLRDRVFCFSDPDSNSGYLYPSYRFMQLGIDPDRFFRRTFFTWAHRNTIDAVASGLADAGAVDSYVWEQYRRHHPEITRKTVIIERSPRFGFPPIVDRPSLAQATHAQLQQTLLNMQDDPGGHRLLEALGLSGFAPPDEQLYAGIRDMWEQLAHRGLVPDKTRRAP